MTRDIADDLLDASFTISVGALAVGTAYAAWSAITLNGYPPEVAPLFVFGLVGMTATVICSEFKIRRDNKRLARDAHRRRGEL